MFINKKISAVNVVLLHFHIDYNILYVLDVYRIVCRDGLYRSSTDVYSICVSLQLAFYIMNIYRAR